MSIAVSVLVKPSRILLGLTLLMCAANVGIALALATGVIGGQPETLHMLAALACVGVAAWAARKILCNRYSVRIDISGLGQIHISTPGAQAELVGHSDKYLNKFDAPQGVLRLLPSSTLWSQLMVLRLASEQGQIVTLFILPDVMAQTSFRALSVACHWIAAHNIRAAGENA